MINAKHARDGVCAHCGRGLRFDPYARRWFHAAGLARRCKGKTTTATPAD